MEQRYKYQKCLKPAADDFLEAPSTALLGYWSTIPEESTLIFDELDMLRGIGVLEDFAMVLRTLVSTRAQSAVQSIPIIIASYLPPHRFIDDRLGSPFNVGAHVRLTNFERLEAETLIRRAFPAIRVRDADALYEFVGGQPFLLQCGLHWLSTGRTMEEFVRQGTETEGLVRSYLQFVEAELNRVTGQSLAQVDLNDLSLRELARLDEAGLVQRHSAGFEWACGLYRMVFQRR